MRLKINNAASVDISEFREPYTGMPIYVDQRDHERYYGRERRRAPVRDILEDLLEEELLEDIIDKRAETESIEFAEEASVEAGLFETWPIAMAYVPWQSFTEIYGPEDALRVGTIFSELNLPFLGGGRR